jgi:WD40 repeat protein
LDPPRKFALEDSIVSASRDKTIKVWELKTSDLLDTINSGHSRYVSYIATVERTPDNTKIVSCGDNHDHDNTIKIWEMNTGKPLNTINGAHDFHVKM